MKSKSKLKPSKPASSKRAELARLRQLKQLLAAGNLDMTEAESIRRLRAAEARLAEMKLGEQEERLIEVEDVRRTWSKEVAACRAYMLGLPSKLAPKLIGQTDPVKVQEILRAEIYRALTAFSEGDRIERPAAGCAVHKEA